jgi:hypothetical protein
MAEHRIVIFAGEGELRRLAGSRQAESLQAAYECIPVASGYEAAAELLAEPALALVVDLSVLTADHAELLDIARDCGVEILGVGSFSAGLSAADFRGIRSVTPGRIGDTLAALAGRPIRLAPAKPAEFQAETDAESPDDAPLGAGGMNFDG